jgi:hypothetical protein
VKIVMNFCFHKELGMSWLIDQLSAFQERLFSIELVILLVTNVYLIKVRSKV